MATPHEYRTVLVLTALQALFQTTGVVIITAGGLAGYMLAADKSLATLPISAWMIGTMLTTIPASLFMGKFGRRAGFALGTLFGALSGALAVVSLINGWFWLFCFAHVFNGAYQGFAQFHRFAAADAASPAFRSRAISYVLLGRRRRGDRRSAPRCLHEGLRREWRLRRIVRDDHRSQSSGDGAGLVYRRAETGGAEGRPPGASALRRCAPAEIPHCSHHGGRRLTA